MPDQKPINSNTLKINGIVELPDGLEMGKDYVIGARMAVPEIAKQDNEDGSFTYAHKGKLTHIELVTKVGTTYKGVAKGSKSQKLRWRIMERGDNDYYERVMEKLINNLDSVLQMLERK